MQRTPLTPGPDRPAPPALPCPAPPALPCLPCPALPCPALPCPALPCPPCACYVDNSAGGGLCQRLGVWSSVQRNVLTANYAMDSMRVRLSLGRLPENQVPDRSISQKTLEQLH